MAYKCKTLASAHKELANIVAYLAEESASSAKKFLDTYEKKLDDICSGTVEYGLSRFPKLAALGYHSVLVSNYVLLYYIEDDLLVVAHIFHQRQNYTSLV